MGRPKVITGGKTLRVSVALSEKQLEAIRRAAIRMSQSEGKLITVSQAIRMAVEQAYPVESQGVLF